MSVNEVMPRPPSEPPQPDRRDSRPNSVERSSFPEAYLASLPPRPRGPPPGFVGPLPVLVRPETPSHETPMTTTRTTTTSRTTTSPRNRPPAGHPASSSTDRFLGNGVCHDLSPREIPEVSTTVSRPGIHEGYNAVEGAQEVMLEQLQILAPQAPQELEKPPQCVADCKAGLNEK